ncbi:MAG: aldehyde dehydrogenase family protein [Candidatus Rokubacteria bacterium]|nr:aldehyde dehydrogenase family protein [Candidatus Rokubacteria bacterium]
MRLTGGPGRFWHLARRALRGRRAWVWAGCLLAALIVFPLVAPAYHVSLGLALLADVALASAWALFSGPTRYLSLAAAAFFGAGAYVTAVLGARAVWPVPVLAGAAAGGLLALPVGLLALRLRGPYFAILTFGLSELVRHSVIWYESNVTGTVGRVLLLQLDRRTLYWGLLVLAVLAVAAAILLRRSRWGLALVAIGGDEERAEVLGIRPTGVKIVVFVLSAALMGATGAAIAPRWTYIDPHIAFNPLISFQVIIMALLGGVGRPAGPVVGALFLGLLSELFLIQFRYAYMIVLGAVLIVTVLGLPHGIMGWRAEERTEDLVRRVRWAIGRRIPRRFTMRRDYQLYIDGEWGDAPGGRTFPDVNPATGEAFARIPAADAATARRAVEAADRARGEWGELQAAQRAAIVLKAAQIWERRYRDLADMLITETGAVAGKAAFEVGYCLELIRQAASLPYQATGEVAPSNVSGKINYFMRKPVGVVSVISPWNVPYVLTLRAVAPALALGNAVVLKPSEESPIVGGLLVAEVFEEAGVPPGVLNVITCSRADVEAVGDVLVTDPAIGVISFTGSTTTGRALAAKAGHHLKRIVLELGGKSPLIVLEDADLDLAVSAATFGGFFHQGQICMAAARILVEHPLADALASQLVEKLNTLKLGDPRDPQTAIGPITSPTQLAKIRAHVDDAVAKGAKVLVGGKSRGQYFEPTVLTGVTPEMRCYYEETFGPVVALMPVKDAEEAVRLANDTTYGLSAAVITGDPERGMALAERIQAGMVHVNDSTVHDEPHAPFGGIKGSGLGRHGGRAAIEAFTELRWVSLQTERRHYPFDH